ncbi:MAG: polysaccharide deacetylase family protein [Candidatus Curtissbacteria bacterium]|nr:polysaccharide deacetylase family protein [Candidatus Curtissbacteria bacterium]
MAEREFGRRQLLRLGIGAVVVLKSGGFGLAAADDPPVNPFGFGFPDIAPVGPTPEPTPAPQAEKIEKYKVGEFFNRGDPDKNYVYLTYDDDYTPRAVWQVINTLEQYRNQGFEVHVTFFPAGGAIGQDKGLWREVIARGHKIGNHTYNHPRMDRVSYQGLKNEILWQEYAVADALRQENDVKLFRPPWGLVTNNVRAVCRDLGYKIVTWTGDSKGYATGATVDRVVLTVSADLKNGVIELMHCNNFVDALATPRILETIRARGLRPISIPEGIE